MMTRQDVELYRGGAARIVFEILDDTGAKSDAVPEAAVWRVADSLGSPTPVFQKSDVVLAAGEIVVDLMPVETAAMPRGAYFHELSCRFDGVTSVVARGILVMRERV